MRKHAAQETGQDVCGRREDLDYAGFLWPMIDPNQGRAYVNAGPGVPTKTSTLDLKPRRATRSGYADRQHEAGLRPWTLETASASPAACQGCPCPGRGDNDRHGGWRGTQQPSGYGFAGDVQLRKQVRITGLPDKLAQAVVVDALAGRGGAQGSAWAAIGPQGHASE